MRGTCEAAIERLADNAVLNAAEVRRIWHAFIASPDTMHWSRPLALVVAGNAIG